MNEPYAGPGAAPEPDLEPQPAAAPETEGAAPAGEAEMHPAREMSLHLLRMLETRVDAASIALQGETQLLMARLQLKVLAGAAIFFAIWGGIVLLAIALPPHLRVPVLSAVVIGFVIAGVLAHQLAKRKASSGEIGSLRWFMDSLRQDLEVLSRALARHQQNTQTRTADRSPPNDLAA
jgi:uncharacterized membrane protein YqjE